VGLFVTLMDPTQQMRTEAVTAGMYKSTTWGKDCPRNQLADLLNRKQPDLPPSASSDVTFKKARVAEDEEREQTELDLD